MRLTVSDIESLKGRRQLTEVCVGDSEEASACEEAGIDMISTTRDSGRIVREAAQQTFLIVAIGVQDPNVVCDRDAIAEGYAAMENGADAIYTGLSTKIVKSMARECIPVVGHVGYVPYRSTWFGGPRAVGKTAKEALEIYEHTLAYQDAGAVAVEMEIVPSRVASEISSRVELSIISMGSGSGGDIQYLFATDILGTNRGHVPRHAKQYADLNKELDRLQELRIDAFSAFREEVATDRYPAREHQLLIDETEYARFYDGLPDR